VIPLGFDGARFNVLSTDQRPHRPGRVGYLGRLAHGKGVDLLVRALGVAGEWRLVINRGPGWEGIRDLADRLGVLSRVSFRQCDYEGVCTFLHDVDVLVLPSRTLPHWREQFGRVLIEAMAAGTPVIGSSSGSIPSVVSDAGLIFPEEDVESLATAIDRLLRDPALWTDLRRRGLDRAAEFTWESVTARTVLVYERVLSGV
jgi:glycosyltransferase involved in cell wall biosynthesis